MCTHPFGAVSSLSSSSYASRKVAVDNSSCYGNGTTAIIIKNIYVDDLLKSVEDEECTEDLIRRIQKMCCAGGFNLKFISNNNSVLVRIPENQRKRESKRC